MDEQFGNNKSPQVENDQTIIISKSSPLMRKLRKKANTTGALVTHRELTLIIRNLAEHIRLEDDKPAVIGRGDLGSGYRPEIDLSSYGAPEYGVSREHARLHLKDQRLYIIDLGSSNGTFVAGQRLTPYRPQVLHEGDEILLGRLAARVEIG
jgi:pSer/pThr/pTyr-binding forkhead associated (FHA) protein